MNKDLSHDLKLFAEHLSLQDFKALSSGLGLGVKKAEEIKRFQAPDGENLLSDKLMKKAPQRKAHHKLQSTLPQASGNSNKPGLPPAGIEPRQEGSIAIGQLRQSTKQRQVKSARGQASSFLRKGLARSLDLVIVVLTLTSTAFAFFYVMEPESRIDGTRFDWVMAKLLSLASPLEIMVGFLFMVGGYTLLFRILAGATLGELTLGVRKSKTMLKE